MHAVRERERCLHRPSWRKSVSHRKEQNTCGGQASLGVRDGVSGLRLSCALECGLSLLAARYTEQRGTDSGAGACGRRLRNLWKAVVRI